MSDEPTVAMRVSTQLDKSIRNHFAALGRGKRTPGRWRRSFGAGRRPIVERKRPIGVEVFCGNKDRAGNIQLTKDRPRVYVIVFVAIVERDGKHIGRNRPGFEMSLDEFRKRPALEPSAQKPRKLLSQLLWSY